MDKKSKLFFNSWALCFCLICTLIVSGKKTLKTARYKEQETIQQQLKHFLWNDPSLSVVTIKTIHLSYYEYY